MRIKITVCVSAVTEEQDLEKYSELNFYRLQHFCSDSGIQKSIILNRKVQNPFPEEMQFWIDYTQDGAEEICTNLVRKIEEVFPVVIQEQYPEEPPF